MAILEITKQTTLALPKDLKKLPSFLTCLMKRNEEN